jgi:hypothetical protein
MRSSLTLIIWCTLGGGLAQAAEPLAYWPMDSIQDGVVADASGHGHAARAHGLDGKLPEVVPGMAGNCLKFTAAYEQYLEIKQSEGLLAPAALTVMAWIKPVARSGTYEIVGNKGDKSGDGPWPGWRLRYFWSRATFQFGAADSSEPAVSSPEWSVPAGFWSHVALTYDGRKLSLYVDCELVDEQEIAAPILTAARPLIIGNYVGRKNAYALDGLLDEVKVCGAVLNAEEIYAEAARGMTP